MLRWLVPLNIHVFMENKKYISTVELAGMLGISRISVFNMIKKGKIQAEKIGRNYAISVENIPEIVKSVLSKKEKKEIEDVVKKVIDEYGETLRLLGKE